MRATVCPDCPEDVGSSHFSQMSMCLSVWEYAAHFVAIISQGGHVMMASATRWLVAAWIAVIASTCTAADCQYQVLPPVVSSQQLDACGWSPNVAAMPACCPGVYGSTSLLYWRPTQRGLAYAVTEDGTSLTIGRGQVHEVDNDRNTGVRAELGYRTATAWALAFRFTSIDFDGNHQVNRPPGIGQLFSTRSHPDGNEEADSASAQTNLDYQVFDLEASRPVVQGSFINWSVFGGIRWAEIGQANAFFYDGRDFVAGEIHEHLQVDGAGLQAGTEGSWNLAYGFGLVGRASAGLMRGRFDSHWRETNLQNNVTLVDITDRAWQALPNIELSLGMSWSRGPLRVSCAYELINWFSVYDRSMFIDDIHEAAYGPFSKDVLLDGVTATVMFTR